LVGFCGAGQIESMARWRLAADWIGGDRGARGFVLISARKSGPRGRGSFAGYPPHPRDSMRRGRTTLICGSRLRAIPFVRLAHIHVWMVIF
jgi:hypothetical protein